MTLNDARRMVNHVRGGNVRLTDDDIHEAALLLLDETERMAKELTLAHNEAARLALFLWKNHYADVSPEFTLCNSAAGIISQIDNMVCGMVKS